MELIQSVGFLDIIFIVILAVSVFLGILRGAVREVLSLAGLAIAIYLAFKFSDSISKNYISQFFEQPRISYLVAFIIIIVTTIFCVALINLLISQLLKVSGLSFLNRVLGLVFGALRGTVFCSILVMMIGFIPGASQEKWWTESTFAPFFKTIVSHSEAYIPQNVSRYFDTTKKTISHVGDAIVKGVTNSAQATDKQVIRPTKQDKTTVKHILQSIDGSLEETQKPNIELESEPTQSSGAKASSPKNKLVLESSQ